MFSDSSQTMTPGRPGLRRRGYVEVISTIAITEYRLRYASSKLGIIWAFAKPLMLFTVLYLVFARALRFGEGIEHYPVMLLLAIVLWSFFAEVTSTATTVFVARADLLRKVAIPPIILPLATSLTAFLIFLGNLLVVGMFVVVSGVSPSMSWLLVPLLIIELVAFALGIALILSVAYPSMRDIGQIWEVGLQVLFYATPIIYPVTLVNEPIRSWLLMSPLGQIFQMCREAAFGTGAGEWSASVTGAQQAVPFLIVATVCVAGVAIYQLRWRQIVERL